MDHAQPQDRVSHPFTVTNRLVLSIALPMTLAYLTTPLLGIADTAIVGQYGDAALLGGLAAGAIVFDVVFTTFNFLRSGTTGLVAQAYGQGNALEEQAVLWRALLVGPGRRSSRCVARSVRGCRRCVFHGGRAGGGGGHACLCLDQNSLRPRLSHQLRNSRICAREGRRRARARAAVHPERHEHCAVDVSRAVAGLGHRGCGLGYGGWRSCRHAHRVRRAGLAFSARAPRFAAAGLRHATDCPYGGHEWRHHDPVFLASCCIRALHQAGRAVWYRHSGCQCDPDEFFPGRGIFSRWNRHRCRAIGRACRGRALPPRLSPLPEADGGVGLRARHCHVAVSAFGRRSADRFYHHGTGCTNGRQHLSALGGADLHLWRSGISDGWGVHRRNLVARHAQHDAAFFRALSRLPVLLDEKFWQSWIVGGVPHSSDRSRHQPFRHCAVTNAQNVR
ncbi:DNA-damage-inducible protein [Nitratireductor aquibiodomus RA22]|uniref:DNA-damage-inducible protein n=1 Tax=Nitratireductor aquibiodomus RA22 TaxID=1189611 RepID=I5BUZ9_9HYPH|nr:DNA-damage-inducible protein [Nitratireductor aquibiodomus RA22]